MQPFTDVYYNLSWLHNFNREWVCIYIYNYIYLFFTHNTHTRIYKISEITVLLEINTLANKSYVIGKLIPLGKHVERS